MPQDATDAIVASTVGEDVAFGPANLGLRGAELEAPRPGVQKPFVYRTESGLRAF